MPRIIAVDYGKVRSGIAVTDPLQIIASGLTTVPSATLIDFLEKYFHTETVSKIIVGEPRQMNNQLSESAAMIDTFVARLQQKFPQLEVVRIDERFTSKMAIQTMIDSGLKKKQRQNKGLVDEIAATILLQSYLSRTMF